MALLKTAWGITATLITLAFTALFLGLTYGITMLILHGAGISGQEYRRAQSRYMFRSQRVVFRLFCALMRIQPNYLHRSGLAIAPTIVIANHQSLVDIFLLMELMLEMKCHDARWVMKEELSSIPIISHVCRGNGSAFINRQDADGAELTMRATARLALKDNASLILFPEGTRRRAVGPEGLPDPAGGPNYHHVRAPKPRGFLAIRQEMPAQEIMVVTIDYGAQVSARSFHQLGELFGRTVIVRAERYYAPSADADWLNARWREIENHFERTQQIMLY